jgi:hypothetical protein
LGGNAFCFNSLEELDPPEVHDLCTYFGGKALRGKLTVMALAESFESAKKAANRRPGNSISN